MIILPIYYESAYPIFRLLKGSEFDLSDKQNPTQKSVVVDAEENLANMISHTQFKHQIFGGVSEQNAWRIIRRLSEEYEKLLDKEKARSKAIIGEYKSSNASLQAENVKLKIYINKLRSGGG